MGGKNQHSVPLLPAHIRVPAIMQKAGKIRFHESNGEIHFHDDDAHIKCTIGSTTVFFQKYETWRNAGAQDVLDVVGVDGIVVHIYMYTDHGERQVCISLSPVPAGQTLRDLDTLAGFTPAS